MYKHVSTTESEVLKVRLASTHEQTSIEAVGGKADEATPPPPTPPPSLPLACRPAIR